MANSNRREFVKMMGITALTSALSENIAKALTVQANNQTGTIQDVEHIVILMQENRPFDHHFGTLQGVRGFSDPRAININLPFASGAGGTQVPVFLQPAGAANIRSGFAVAPNSNNLGGPANGVPVIPPFRVKPAAVRPGQMTVGLTYLPGTNHSWQNTGGACWNLGQYDSFASKNGPMTMSYMTRQDLPYRLRARGRLHGWRRLPLLTHGPHQSESLLSVDWLRWQCGLPWGRGHRRIRLRAGHR